MIKRQVAITLPSLLLAAAFVLFSLTTTLLSFEASPPVQVRCKSGVNQV